MRGPVVVGGVRHAGWTVPLRRGGRRSGRRPRGGGPGPPAGPEDRAVGEIGGFGGLFDPRAAGCDDPAPFAEAGLGEALLTPTRIYVRAALAAHRAGLLRGLAHITGGGLIDNPAHILPPGLAAELDPGAWDLPASFRWLAEAGRVPPSELARTFNCGIGMAVVTAPDAAGAARRLFEAEGERVFEIGVVAQRTPGLPVVTLAQGGAAWPG